jgi:hypothetical protein
MHFSALSASVGNDSSMHSRGIAFSVSHNTNNTNRDL